MVLARDDLSLVKNWGFSDARHHTDVHVVLPAHGNRCLFSWHIREGRRALPSYCHHPAKALAREREGLTSDPTLIMHVSQLSAASKKRGSAVVL